ncbi:hypothetical protein FACS1894111_05030 [Clostridia bacterium]|nr:hypothetical protein FACS1894111_05030 [Clostridia bacterium]
MSSLGKAENVDERMEAFVQQLLQSTRSNLKTNMFLVRFARSEKAARELRIEQAQSGHAVLPWLFADLQGERENLSAQEWIRSFSDAADTGVSFCVLKGTDSTKYQEILRGAAKIRRILFMLLTDEKQISDQSMRFFEANRNIIPFFTIEGVNLFREIRSGLNVFSEYAPVVKKMERCKDLSVIFGAFITVSAENVGEIVSKEFLNRLYDRGCRCVFYVTESGKEEEVDNNRQQENQRYLKKQLKQLKSQHMGMLLLEWAEFV